MVEAVWFAAANPGADLILSSEQTEPVKVNLGGEAMRRPIAIAVVAIMRTAALGAAPELINYQGRLTDAGGQP